MMILKRAAAVPEHETKTGAPDRDATRSMLVAETLVSARFAAFVPAALTALLLVFFRGSSESLTLLGPLGVLCCLACGVTAAVAFAHPLALRRSADIVSRGAAVCALFAGTALGAIPLLAYAPADGDHRLLLLGTLGAAVANVAVLGPIASIGLLYLLPLLGGGVVGLARTGEPISIAVSLLLVVAGWVIMWAVRKRQALAARRIADGLRAAALGETVETLLLDVEAGTAEWIWETDASGRLRAVSERIAEAARLPVERLDGCPLKMIFTMQHPGVPMAEGARVVCETIAARKPFRNELVEVKTRDTSIWWRLTGKPVLDASGAFVGYRGVGCDITAARDTEARILQLATTDTLTGLANREQFQVHAERECTAAAVDGRWRALLFLDLDGFKSVNDALGHAAGDDVLREAARRLLQSVPRGCMVSRLGGDEFGIWYDAKTPSRAEALALDLIEALTVPFDVQGAQVANRRQRGDRLHAETRGRRRQPARQGRPRALPGEDRRAGPPPDLHRGVRAVDRGAARARGRPEAGARPRRIRAALPAARRPPARRDRLLRGVDPLDLADAGPCLAGRFHPRRRGVRPHHGDRHLGPVRGLRQVLGERHTTIIALQEGVKTAAAKLQAEWKRLQKIAETDVATAKEREGALRKGDTPTDATRRSQVEEARRALQTAEDAVALVQKQTDAAPEDPSFRLIARAPVPNAPVGMSQATRLLLSLLAGLGTLAFARGCRLLLDRRGKADLAVVEIAPKKAETVRRTPLVRPVTAEGKQADPLSRAASVRPLAAPAEAPKAKMGAPVARFFEDEPEPAIWTRRTTAPLAARLKSTPMARRPEPLPEPLDVPRYAQQHEPSDADMTDAMRAILAEIDGIEPRQGGLPTVMVAANEADGRHDAYLIGSRPRRRRREPAGSPDRDRSGAAATRRFGRRRSRAGAP